MTLNIQEPAPGQTASRVPQMFAALAVPAFRAFLLSMVFSYIPMQMMQVVQGYLAFTMTGSAAAVGFVQSVWGAPQILLVLIAGVLADRFERNRIIGVTQVFLSALGALLAFLVYTGIIEYWQLVTVAVIHGTVFAFNMPGKQGMLSQVVTKDTLANAVALNNALINVTRIFAPGIAGALIAVPLVGPGGVYTIMAVSYAISTIIVWQCPVPPPPRRDTRESFFQSIAGGFRYIGGRSLLRTMFFVVSMFVLLGVPYITLMPVFALDVFDIGSPGLGLMFLLTGIGALVGSFFVAATSDSRHRLVYQALSILAFGVALFVFAASRNYTVALVMVPLLGAFQTMFMSFNATEVMQGAEEAILGRVMSIHLLIFSVSSLTTLPVTALVDVFSAPVVVSVLGLLLALFGICLTVWFARLKGPRDLRQAANESMMRR